MVSGGGIDGCRSTWNDNSQVDSSDSDIARTQWVTSTHGKVRLVICRGSQPLVQIRDVIREDQIFDTTHVLNAVDIALNQVLAQLEETRKQEARRQPPLPAAGPETDTNFPT